MESRAREEAIKIKPGRIPPVLKKVSLLLLAASALALGIAQALALQPAFQVSIEDPSQEMSPAVPIDVSLSRFGASVASVTLLEQKLDINGRAAEEESLPVALFPARGDLFSYWADLRLGRADGSSPVGYDAIYRLQVTFNRWIAAFPVPVMVQVAQEYTFRTPITPQVRVVHGVQPLDYKKPLRLDWNSPVQRFDVEVEPRLDIRSWVDPSDPLIGYVDLNNGDPGKQYLVKVVSAYGTNGAPMTSPVSLAVETAALPKPITDGVKLEDGDRVVLRWDHPLTSIKYQIEPSVDNSYLIDPDDRRIVHILLRGAEQQQDYQVAITGGMGLSGAPVEANHEFTVSTPAPLAVIGADPVDTAFGIALLSPITITFDESIKDRSAVEDAFSIAPAVAGHFRWPNPNQLQFVPEERYPDMSEITVDLKGGPRGPRGVSGSYLDESMEYAFRTRPNKLIDVDLAQQEMTLFEADQPIAKYRVATGVRGAETPTGEYLVSIKWNTLRMRGVNPDGSRYDIPNVPWVMSFLGDYTIHGAPWRQLFGVPQSNGCVSLETATAKAVFDWTPIGTPVRIHY